MRCSRILLLIAALIALLVVVMILRTSLNGRVALESSDAHASPVESTC